MASTSTLTSGKKINTELGELAAKSDTSLTSKGRVGKLIDYFNKLSKAKAATSLHFEDPKAKNGHQKTKRNLKNQYLR